MLVYNEHLLFNMHGVNVKVSLRGLRAHIHVAEEVRLCRWARSSQSSGSNSPIFYFTGRGGDFLRLSVPLYRATCPPPPPTEGYNPYCMLRVNS